MLAEDSIIIFTVKLEEMLFVIATTIPFLPSCQSLHYHDDIISARESQITSLTIVYWSVYSGADQRKHQSSAPLAFVSWIHRRPVISPHKGSVTRKIFPFDIVTLKVGVCCMRMLFFIHVWKNKSTLHSFSFTYTCYLFRMQINRKCFNVFTTVMPKLDTDHLPLSYWKEANRSISYRTACNPPRYENRFS